MDRQMDIVNPDIYRRSNFDNRYALLSTPNAYCDMLMRIFTPYLIFQCVFTDFQCVITLLRALSVALCTSRLVVQHPCQVSFKSMQGCRRSWEDKLKCLKILSVKGHNSAKICQTWIISPHALLDLWYNICTKFHSNPCKDVGGVEKTNFVGRKEGMTEGRTKQTLNAPLPFYGGA